MSISTSGGFVIGVAALVALGACSDAPAHRGFPAELTQAPVPVDSVRARVNAAVTQGRQSAIVDAAARVSPSVVSVNVIRRRRVARRFTFDPFFVPREYDQLVEGVGSGFLISAAGLVVTNQHVTEGAEQVVISTRDGTDFPAQLLGEDPLTDIAVLQIEGRDFPAVTVGQSRDLAIGEWVLAIGNPYSYLLGNTEPTVTAGVVSAVGRNILPSDDQPTVYVDMIQTDAAINPGNSGGPLVNVLGEVVGVNSSIFTNSGGSVGIGFAIPIERALRVARELTEFGEVRRSWVGLDVAGSGNLRRWKEVGGLPITQVAPSSPADRAGLRRGDVLREASGRRLRTFLDWEAAKLEVSPGDSIVLRFTRNQGVRTAVIAVADLPSTQAERVSVLDFELITVTPAIQQERGLRRDFGALIYALGDQAARVTGLQSGDVILQINRRRVNTADDVRDLLGTIRRRTAIRMYVERDGRLRQSDFFVR